MENGPSLFGSLSIKEIIGQLTADANHLTVHSICTLSSPHLPLMPNDSLKLPFREHPAIATLIENDYSMFAIPQSFFRCFYAKSM